MSTPDWRQLAEVKQVRIDRLKQDLDAAHAEVDRLRSASPPTRLHLQGDGWSEGLPIVSLERDGDTLRVVAAPQIRSPGGLYDPGADRDNAAVQVLARQPVDEILARYRDGNLDAVAVAALARKAREGDQLKAALRRDPTTGPVAYDETLTYRGYDCLVCGAVLDLTAPVPIGAGDELAKRFVEKHRGCGDRAADIGGVEL